MKVSVLNIAKTEIGKEDLPVQFKEEVREDLVKKAVLAIQSRKRQPYGAKPDAGMRASAEVSRRRRAFRGSYGHGISRVPRKVMTKRGTQHHWVGAVAPGTVGGRRAHPPKADKIWAHKINTKERRKAIRGALSATVIPAIVENRGHVVPKDYPFIIEDKFEKIEKTKDVINVLLKLGLEKELERAAVKKVRAGKGTMRGRKYRKKKGPLLVVSDKCPLLRSAKNIPGVDIVDIKNINTELLAPGTDVGRLTLYTQSAIKKLNDNNLFM